MKEVDEIINSNTDLSAKEKAEIDEFFVDTKQDQLDETASRSEEFEYKEFKESLVAVNTEAAVAKEQIATEQTISAEKAEVTESFEKKSSEVVVEEVTIEAEEIIQEDKMNYKAESLKVTNKDDVMKALKKKPSDESFKPQKLVKNRIASLFAVSAESSPASSTESMQENTILQRTASFEKKQQLAILEDEKLMEEEVRQLELKKRTSEIERTDRTTYINKEN